ncbi:MAG: hypothetical protein JEZ00_09385 [Anaerolineaceae bacterium]|nr:hypothetical protein [Anaerolineaceae bacterium]
MAFSTKDDLKNLISQIPFMAELYWLVRNRGKPIQSRFSLQNLEAALPNMIEQAQELRKSKNEHQDEPFANRNVFIFANLHFWIEHAALLGTALAAQGHDVNFGYLPYGDWQAPINRFDLRRQNAYAKAIMEKLSPLVKSTSLLTLKPNYKPLPPAVEEIVEKVTDYDVQYTLQTEDIDKESDIYKLRYERNTRIARSAHAWLKNGKADVVIVPNGSIIEMGIVYRLAKMLNIQVVTYEFGDQRDRIWIAHDDEVMRQNTDKVWEAKKDIQLNKSQMERIKGLCNSRQKGAIWENFARLWQGTPASGGEKVRQELKLDHRPIALLATNVLGDSLTLGRQLFSKNMEEWIVRTVQYFAGIEDVQLVIRIHPGEVLTHGTSMEEVVRKVLPELPENIHVIGPEEEVNTYDVMEIADFGLVYTTTVGLEMAMSGIPVVVAGNTHYRNRGFTMDPDSWVAYYKMLRPLLEAPGQFKLTKEQTELAWRYAYNFFFEYPLPFPWHLVNAWDDFANIDLQAALTGEGKKKYQETFLNLVGKPLHW